MGSSLSDDDEREYRFSKEYLGIQSRKKTILKFRELLSEKPAGNFLVREIAFLQDSCSCVNTWQSWDSAEKDFYTEKRLIEMATIAMRFEGDSGLQEMVKLVFTLPS